MTTEPRFRNRLTESTTPAILRLGPGDYKVSPYAPEYPDGDALWCDTRGQAEYLARHAAIAPRTELQALNRELDVLHNELVGHVGAGTAPDAMAIVQALRALRTRAAAAGENRAAAIIDGKAPCFG